jgi:hypothetical protein
MKSFKIINNDNGDLIKIVAELCMSPNFTKSIGNYILILKKGESIWKPLKDKSIVPIGKILKTNQELLDKLHPYLR